MAGTVVYFSQSDVVQALTAQTWFIGTLAQNASLGNRQRLHTITMCPPCGTTQYHSQRKSVAVARDTISPSE